MDWIKGIDWERLQHPHPSLRVFKCENPDDPTDPFFKKVARFQRLAMKEYLWLSDEYRNEQAIGVITNSYFFSGGFNVFYETGDFQALIGFTDIISGFKCNMTFKLIDKDIWGADFARAAKELFDLYIKEFRLKRISSETADIRILRMAQMGGFVLEGTRPDAFRWNKKYYPIYTMGKYGGE